LRNESWRLQQRTLQSFISLRLHAPPRPQARSMPPEFQISILPHHVYTLAAGNQRFRASYLPASTSTSQQRVSIPPYLYPSHSTLPCLVATLTARLQSSGAPYLYASSSTHLQPASRALELHTSLSPRLHACSGISLRVMELTTQRKAC